MSVHKESIIGKFVVVGVFILMTFPIMGQTAPITMNSGSNQSPTEYELTPYIWTAGIDGRVGAKNIQNTVDADFGDIVEFLDVGALFMLEGKQGQWTTIVDYIYMKFTDGINTPQATINAVIKQTIVEILVGYALDNGKDSLEVVSGLRYADIKANINYQAVADINGNKDWVDPVVGLRKKTVIGDKWTLGLMGNIGGFGISSDFIWEAVGTLEYEFTDNLTGKLAYRHMDFDYREGGFLYDVAMDGVALGLGLSF